MCEKTWHKSEATVENVRGQSWKYKIFFSVEILNKSAWQRHGTQTYDTLVFFPLVNAQQPASMHKWVKYICSASKEYPSPTPPSSHPPLTFCVNCKYMPAKKCASVRGLSFFGAETPTESPRTQETAPIVVQWDKYMCTGTKIKMNWWRSGLVIRSQCAASRMWVRHRSVAFLERNRLCIFPGPTEIPQSPFAWKCYFV